MPQLEKTTPVFSDSQYEGGGDNIITQRASNNDVKKVCIIQVYCKRESFAAM